jgi:hypothetical protein
MGKETVEMNDFLARHPTHWNWTEHTQRNVDHILGWWAGWVSANTYTEHPEDFFPWRDATSADFWDIQGRGFAIDSTVGEEIQNYVMNTDPVGEWGLEWIIWWGWIWTPFHGWRKYWIPEDMHFDHVHMTFSF